MPIRVYALVISEEIGFCFPFSHAAAPGREAVADQEEIKEAHQYVARGRQVLLQLLPLAGDQN